MSGGQHQISNFVPITVTIDISEDNDLSTAAACQGFILMGLVMPDAWTAGNITFEGSIDGGSEFKQLKDEDNNVITVTSPAADTIVYMLPASPVIAGLTHLKVASSVAQLADRAITLIFAVPNP